MELRGLETVAPLSSLIRSYRHAAGLTQRELAMKAGLSTAAVRDLEQGRRSRPRVGSIAALSNALRLGQAQARALEDAARKQTGLAEGDSFSPVASAGQGKPLWIEILGPLTVWRDGEQLAIGSPAQQLILGLMAVHPGTPVRRETILDLLWGERPPRTAMTLVQAHVSRLRQMLMLRKDDDCGERTITSVAGGYLLRLGDGDLDLLVFRRLVKQAELARESGDTTTACTLFGAAFELCTGDPFANVSLLWGHPAIAEVRRGLTGALLRYAEVATELGRHDLVLHRLQALAAVDRLNERVHAHLMVALAGYGEQAAALQVYEDLRSRLDSELGLYPGEELAQAHIRLLRGGIRATDGQQFRANTHTADAAVVPRQLPAVPNYFTGRSPELATLARLLNRHTDAERAVPVVALTGMAGIGKSALAGYWAHQIADRFPGGQLFSDLGGFSPAGVPASPVRVIRGFLSALGVPDWRIPGDTDGQLTLYRSLLANRRVLIVLDNAQNAEQVRPLLPGAPGCFVLVTSRNRLTGLAASHGASLLPLDCLTQEQSRSLLARGLGEQRVVREDRAASEIISLCARLPLALCNTIARAAAHPGMSLGDLASSMRDERGRLDALETGEKATSARVVFSWSHAKLSGRAERMFRLMALHPGPDLTVPSAASLTALSRRDAHLALAELSDGYLVTEHLPGRYTCHELLHAYAGELAAARETDADRRAARRRVQDHFLHTVHDAWRHILPLRSPRVPPPVLPGVTPERFDSGQEAEAWLRMERQVLLNAMEQAVEYGISPHAWELPLATGPFLRGVECWRLMVPVLERGLAIARRIDNHGGQALAHRQLGWLSLRLGHLARAYDHLDSAMREARDAQDPHSLASACLLRSRVLQSQGRVADALAEGELALDVYVTTEDRYGEFRAAAQVAWYRERKGDGRGAELLRQHARELHRSLRGSRKFLP